jgi:hypothetical protein
VSISPAIDMTDYEAWQWDGTTEHATEIIDWVLSRDGVARYHHDDDLPGLTRKIVINVPGGVLTIAPGGIVIRTRDGKFYRVTEEA